MGSDTGLAVCLVLGLCTSCPNAFAAQGRPKLKLPPGVEMKRGVVYGKGGGRDLVLDLFLPKSGSRPRPAVVFVHGGGWRGGTRRQFHPQAAYLGGQGYVCACIEYRFSGEAKFPAALEDCKCAVRWMRANAKTYKIDPNRVAVCGGSSGGHLAAMVGLTDKSHGFEGKGGHAGFSSDVRAVVAFNGVLDLVDCGERGRLTRAMKQFLGATYRDDPTVYERASPASYVDAKAPPFLLLHGTADTTVPYAQSVEMMKRLCKLGVPAELYEARNAKHGFFNKPPEFTPTLERMEAFFDKHVRGRSHPSTNERARSRRLK